MSCNVGQPGQAWQWFKYIGAVTGGGTALTMPSAGPSRELVCLPHTRCDARTSLLQHIDCVCLCQRFFCLSKDTGQVVREARIVMDQSGPSSFRPPKP